MTERLRRSGPRAAAGVLAAGVLLTGVMYAQQSAPTRGQHHFVMKGEGRPVDGAAIDLQVKLTAADTEGRYTVQDETWDANFNVPAHFHKEHAESFYLADGELEWTVGGETYRMGSGDILFVPADTVHAVKVLGGKPAHVFFIWEPGGYEMNEARERAYTPEQRKDPKIQARLNAQNDFNVATAATRTQHAAQVYVKKGAGRMFDMGTNMVEVKLSAADTNGRYSFQDEQWYPKFDVIPHYHKWRSETFYLLDGQLEWTVGGETRLMGKGDLVYIPPNTVHAVKVVGQKNAHVLFISEPGGYEHYEEEELSYTPAEREKPAIKQRLRISNDFNVVEK